MSFQSPTAAVSIPVSAKQCATPEQCVTFAVACIVRQRSRARKLAIKKAKRSRASETQSKINELVTIKDIETAATSLFAKKGNVSEWTLTAIETLLANGTLVNVNAGTAGMAPVFRLTTPLHLPSDDGGMKVSSAKKSESKVVDNETKELARKATLLNRKMKKIKRIQQTIRKRK